MNYSKPIPQVTLETMMKKNREESDRLLKQSKALLEENRSIESEMTRILIPSVPPPVSSVRPDPMSELIVVADALVRSWKRRHKKNFKQLESDLVNAMENVNGRP
jgi:pantothenate kinase type III